MKKIVVFGSFVCDLVCRMERFPQAGESVIGESFNTFLGGKGANQCVAIKRLDGDVSMIGKVGNDSYGDNFIKLFNDEKIDTSLIKRSIKNTGIGAIQINGEGQNRICIILGANLDFNLNDFEEVKYKILESDIFLTQFEMTKEVTEEAIKFAKNNNLITIVNPAPARNISLDVFDKIDFITPNETELEFLTGIKINDVKDVYKASEILFNKGIKNIITTLGNKGAFIYNKDIKALISSYKVNAIDTVAAGDSFNGALAYGLSNDLDVIEAIKFANAMGALTTTKNGAIPSLHYLNEVNDFIKNSGDLEVIFYK